MGQYRFGVAQFQGPPLPAAHRHAPWALLFILQNAEKFIGMLSKEANSDMRSETITPDDDKEPYDKVFLGNAYVGSEENAVKFRENVNLHAGHLSVE